MYNFKFIMENRARIRGNQKDLDTVEKMIGLEKEDGEFKRVGAIPEAVAGPDAPVEYEMDGLVAKLKVEEPAP